MRISDAQAPALLQFLAHGVSVMGDGADKFSGAGLGTDRRDHSNGDHVSLTNAREPDGSTRTAKQPSHAVYSAGRISCRRRKATPPSVQEGGVATDNV